MGLKAFKFERILNQGWSVRPYRPQTLNASFLDPVTHAISFLGTLPNTEGVPAPAIVRIEKTALPDSSAQDFAQIVHDVEKIEKNDIVRPRFLQI
jgi:hypothetical protein